MRYLKSRARSQVKQYAADRPRYCSGTARPKGPRGRHGRGKGHSIQAHRGFSITPGVLPTPLGIPPTSALYASRAAEKAAICVRAATGRTRRPEENEFKETDAASRTRTARVAPIHSNAERVRVTYWKMRTATEKTRPSVARFRPASNPHALGPRRRGMRSPPGFLKEATRATPRSGRC